MNIENEKEEFYQDIVTSLFDVVFLLDDQGKIIYLSPQAQEAFGYKSSEVEGKLFYEFVHPEDVSDLLNRLQNFVLLDHHPVYFRLLDKNKQERFVRTHCNKQKDGYLVGTVSDLTRYQNKFLQQLENEKKYHYAFEYLALPMVVIKDKRIADCNEEALKMFACQREDIVDKNILIFSLPEQEDGISTNVKMIEKSNMAKSGKTETFKWNLVNKKGKFFTATVVLKYAKYNEEDYFMALFTGWKF